MIFAPSRASLSAVARPIPEPPPVTNATLSSSNPAMLLSFRLELGYRPKRARIANRARASEIVIVAATRVVVAAEVAAAFQFVDRVIEFRAAEFVAHLAPHLAHR